MIIETPWKRWLLALLAYATASALNFLLQPLLEGRAPLLPYYPVLVLTGFLGGAGPGLAVLAAAALTLSIFWIEPVGELWPQRLADLLILSLFLPAGGLAVGVSAWSRRLLQQAQTTRERLNMALSAGRMTAWDWDVRTGAVSFSGGADAVFGKTWTHADEAWSLGHPEDAQRVRALVEDALRQGRHYTFFSRMYRADTGELRWVETHGHVHCDALGRAVRVSGVTADVTDRQLALQASQAAEERFHLALESGKVTAWECDAERCYTWITNTRFGLQPGDVLGRRIGETIPNEDHKRALERVYADGEPVQFQVDGRFRDQPYHLLCSVRAASRDADGRVTRVIGASVDVTELAEVQAQLRRESQRKDAFLATLAHELRNPMAPIRYAVAMLDEGVAPAVREQARAIIGRQAAHMARLLDDLLDMSRITRNAIELRCERLDLRGVIGQAVDNTRPACAALRHRLVVSLPPRPVWVDGDATRLQQVLGNLLDNAAKYTRPGGEITVRLDPEGAEALVSVSDNGIGIAPADQAQVFELFTQVQRTGQGSGGLGIGLAVVRQLVELHGGRIGVHSEGVDRGSRFTLRLPLAAGAGEAQPLPDAKVVSLFPRMPTVLIVDDNQDAADSLVMLLRTGGFAASAVHDGAAALRAFDQLQPRVLLLDLGLPDMSGLEVAREIRRRPGGAAVTLIAITGWGQEKDRAQTAQAGFDQHLVKPVDPARLQALLRALQPAALDAADAG